MSQKTKNSLVIINSINDAENCVRQGLETDGHFLTTHASAALYLKEKHNIACRCISTFFSNREIIEAHRRLGVSLEKILADLDRNVSPVLNEQLGLQIRYFWPLYAYWGWHEFAATFFLFEGLKKAVTEHNPDIIRYCNSNIGFYLSGNADLSHVLRVLFKDKPLANIDCKPGLSHIDSPGKRTSAFRLDNLEDLITGLRYFYGLFRILLKNRLTSGYETTILLCEPLRNLSFLKAELDGCDFIYLNDHFKKHLPFKKLRDRFGKRDSRHAIDIPDASLFGSETEPFVDVFLKNIKTDITRNITDYVSLIEQVRGLDGLKRNALAIWGLSPVEGKRALLFEYLSTIGVTILGSQHGSTYGETYRVRHFDSDYNRCDYFFSYGFTESDLLRIFPDKNHQCKIVPAGSSKPARTRAKTGFDILFPIQNTMPLFQGGMSRISPAEILDRQMKILEFLNTLENLKIYIKPFKHAHAGNFAPMIAMERLNNLTFVRNLSLKGFFRKYLPKMTIIEYPSTPLYDCLHQDTEIFLLSDPLYPFEEAALGKLKKRVHYANHVEDLIHQMELFIDGKIAPKRDNAFYNHYVYRSDRKKTVLSLIHELAST